MHFQINNDMDAATMIDLRDDFERLAQANGDVELDVAQVTFMDSSGVGGLVYLYKRLQAEGRSLMVRGLSGQPRQLLEHLSVAGILSPAANAQ